jgi:hypothetical protein
MAFFRRSYLTFETSVKGASASTVMHCSTFKFVSCLEQGILCRDKLTCKSRKGFGQRSAPYAGKTLSHNQGRYRLATLVEVGKKSSASSAVPDMVTCFEMLLYSCSAWSLRAPIQPRSMILVQPVQATMPLPLARRKAHVQLTLSSLFSRIRLSCSGRATLTTSTC